MIEQLDDESAGTEIENNDEKIWSNSNTWCLVKIRLQREKQFSDGIVTKNSLWNEISRELGNSRGILVSGDKCSKKFGNLKITYNNNKEKLKDIVNPSVNPPSWEFFDLFESIYGDKEIKCRKRSLSALKEIHETLQSPIKKPRLVEPIPTEETPPEIINGGDDSSDWWKEYFNKKLQLEGQRIIKEEKQYRSYIKMETDRTKAIDKLTAAILVLASNKRDLL